jgi:predicted PurR-regulated permease PerM
MAMSTQRIVIDISRETIWRIIFTLLVLAAIVKLKSLIFYLLFALLFAVALYPLVGWFQSKGMKRNSALALVLVLIVGTIFAMFGLVAVSLIDTVASFIRDLPVYIDGLRQYDALAPHIDSIQKAYTNLDVGALVQNGLSSGSSLLSGVSKAFEAILFTFFFTVYMILERDYIKRIITSILPKKWQARGEELEDEFVDVVGGYIRGQILTSFLTGLAAYIIFRVLGLPNALALGIIAGLTDIIPVVGGLIGLVPATLVAFTISPIAALLCVVLVQSYSTFSNYFIAPKIYGNALNMSPFIVTIATMVGLILFGIPGIILALPGAAMIGYVLTKYYGIPIIEEENA